MTDTAVRLDLGCGKNKIKVEGQEWIGVDAMNFPGVDVIHDLKKTPWILPYEISGTNHVDGDERSPVWSEIPDNYVDEVHCSHFLEHLTGEERIHFFNELYRVLKPGGQARIITPHWSNERAYGDPTHKWPPVCSWTYFYLDAGWREVNAPHAGYTCDFTYTLAGTHDPNDTFVAFRNNETKATMMARNINTVVDLYATIVKRVPA